MNPNVAPILAAGAGRSERLLQVSVYALFALVAVLLACFLPAKERLAEVLVMVLALPTFFLWMGWFSRLMLLQAQADAMLVPALPREIAGTLLLMVAVTVGLPAALVSFVGGGFLWALSCLACIAASGVLLALLQRGLAGLLGFLPMAVGAFGGDAMGALVEWHSIMPALACLLALLAAWRWLRVSADIDRWQQPDWRQPLVFAMGRRGSVFAGSDLLDPRVQEGMVPRWLRSGANLQAFAPGEVRTLRALLGGVFAPVGPKQLLATLAIYGVVLAILVRYFQNDGDSPWQMVLFMGLFAGGMVLAAPFALRLQGLQQNPGGDMAELALLPGWGEPAQARAALVRAVAQVFGRAALVVLLLMLGAAVMTGNLLVVLLATVSTLAVIAIGIVAWLRPLAGRPWHLNAWIAALVFLLGTPLLGCTVAAFGGGSLLLPMLVAWSLLLLAAHWPALRLWQAFQRRPQPFLMD